MLDQNTDRMWYVIGAVIVGAALIFLMNSTFPTLFANVGTTFEEKVGDTTEMTDGIMPIQRNLYDASKVMNTGIAGYYPDSAVPPQVYEDPETRSFYFRVEPGDKYTITRSDKRNSRFGYAFAVKEPNQHGRTLIDPVNRYDNALVMENIVVPTGVRYFYLYLSDANAVSTDLPDITIHKVY